MIFLIALSVIIILGVIFSWRSAQTESRRYGKYTDFGDFGSGLFLTAIVGVAFTLIYTAILAGTGPLETRTEAVRLEALGNDSETNAAFFLGFGVLDEEQVFQYLEKAQDGGVTLHTANAGDVIIYEDAEHGAYKLTKRQYYNDPFWFPGDVPGIKQATRYEYHVPEGSINKEYRVSVTG